LETPLEFGLEILLRGARRRAQEFGAESGAAQGEVKQPVVLSSTPSSEIYNHALEIRRKVQAKNSAGE